MTPLIEKLLKESDPKIGLHFQFGKQCSHFNILLFKHNSSLRNGHPVARMYAHDYMLIRVGIDWIKKNLNEEEMAEFVAMRLKGEIK